MKTVYTACGWLTLIMVGLFSQTPPTKKDTTTKTEPVVPLKQIEQKKLDSMLNVANADLDVAITTAAKIPKKKEELLQVKLKEQKAMKNYIEVVDEYLKTIGRQEKLVLKKDLKQQLQEGEIFLVKDSVCTSYKRYLLVKKKCENWKYSFYLQDKDGNKEELF